jgi:toxin ParE1/3/4
MAEESPKAALRLLDAFDQTISALALMPHCGSQYQPLDPKFDQVRIWPIKGFRNFLIFFQLADDEVTILRVLHGARDYDTNLLAPNA